MNKIIQDNWTFQGLVTFLTSPLIATDKLPNSATPNISGKQSIKASGSIVTITNFLKGADGQSISILGDGTTTVKNNTNIVTNTGADILLASNLIYRFTYFNLTGKWHQDK